MIWFTSDEHFFHKNVIRLCNRPFVNLDEMHKTLVDNHNSVVSKNDTVYHLGDFAFGRGDHVGELILKLNGQHIFMKGNHDDWMKSKKINFDLLMNGNMVDYGDEYKEIHYKNEMMVLCHYPMRTWNRSHYGVIQLYGHCHGNLESLKNQYDVGVDNNDYFPISIDDIRMKLATSKKC